LFLQSCGSTNASLPEDKVGGSVQIQPTPQSIIAPIPTQSSVGQELTNQDIGMVREHEKEEEAVVEQDEFLSQTLNIHQLATQAQKGDSDALVKIIELSKNHHPSAQYSLGFMYAKGLGIHKDEIRAVEWFQKAADQGDIKAQYSLGFMYLKGLGIHKDEVKALKWYQKAADQGDMRAQHNLGAMYTNGQGVAKDQVRGVEWFQKAAIQGDIKAQYYLGVAYSYGRGVAKDEVKAREWYQKAADQGDMEAQILLTEPGCILQ
jgi:TPR repeat protein